MEGVAEEGGEDEGDGLPGPLLQLAEEEGGDGGRGQGAAEAGPAFDASAALQHRLPTGPMSLRRSGWTGQRS